MVLSEGEARETRETDRLLAAREDLLESIQTQTGVHDERVLRAFARVPRHEFLPSSSRTLAYRDAALPIGYEQTISQPSMIAIMLSALQVEPEHRVLEVGAGSGYAAALLGELAREVNAIEILPELASAAQARLSGLGYGNVHIVVGNGRHGFPERAPYDRILVSAGTPDIPQELEDQLAIGGRIAIPVGDDRGQRLLIGDKLEDGSLRWQKSIPCIFVPLTGAS
jgi:protein-L-isoaspartate(D-aspartate) O-methyltransferase